MRIYVLGVLSGDGVLDADAAGLRLTTIAVGRLRLFTVVDLGFSRILIGAPVVLLLFRVLTTFGTGTIADGAEISRRRRPLLVT